MRQHIIDHVAGEAGTAGRAELAGGATRRTVAVAAMRAASSSHTGPTSLEAFEASVAALSRLYPDDATLRQEADAIGSRNARAALLDAGDHAASLAVELVPMPAEPIGLLDAWNEATDAAIPPTGTR